jgi:hypothetical protein
MPRSLGVAALVVAVLCIVAAVAVALVAALGDGIVDQRTALFVSAGLGVVGAAGSVAAFVLATQSTPKTDPEHDTTVSSRRPLHTESQWARALG